MIGFTVSIPKPTKKLLTKLFMWYSFDVLTGLKAARYVHAQNM